MSIDSVPSIHEDGIDWKPIQHYFGLTAFGLNVYRADAALVELIGEHDERTGRHEEVYLVLGGHVRFEVGRDSFSCAPGTLVVICDPAVRRRGVAETADASVLVIGNRQAEQFESTWDPQHFDGVPTYDSEHTSS
jgi:hypothetical protein